MPFSVALWGGSQPLSLENQPQQRPSWRRLAADTFRGSAPNEHHHAGTKICGDAVDNSSPHVGFMWNSTAFRHPPMWGGCSGRGLRAPVGSWGGFLAL